MKRLLIFVLFLFIFSSNIFAKQKIVLVTGEWSPYTSYRIKGYGFFTEIVSAVFEEAGLDFEYKFYPWLRCEYNLKKGIAFAAFPYFINDDRKKKFNFSKGIVKSTSRLFYLKSRIKSDIKWMRYEDLKPYTIGGSIGYWYRTKFEKANLTIDYGYNDKIGFKKLYAGRYDFLATNELVGWALIRKMYPEEINKFCTVKKPLQQDYLHLMISRTYPDHLSITKRINEALLSIKRNGIYLKILEKNKIE
ncbi:MAG: transporter substrate-binding domain-containing protein [Desulfobacterales bacterium]|nr:transporter substrate-binding domain-containing protein [Desulfobacterales bacterium]MCP4164028.1 transporter substrate-binding domain-containing protein [Deltaproteobacteria bacterium]